MKSLNQVQEILTSLTPYIIAAGDYAEVVQSRVAHQPSKGIAENPFADALTDADLSVQGFIEVALLAHHPEVAFFGEEYEQSLNMKYFPSDAELMVFLDPIDGTRFYKDNLPNYNIIVTIADREEVLGAALYTPGKDIFLTAVRGKGLRGGTRESIHSGAELARCSLKGNPGVIVTYNLPELTERISGDYRIIDVLKEYLPGKGCPSINGPFQEECSAIVGRDVGLIDWGAIAFLTSEDGWLVSDMQGKPLPPVSSLDEYRYPEVLVAQDRKTQEAVIKALC